MGKRACICDGFDVSCEVAGKDCVLNQPETKETHVVVCSRVDELGDVIPGSVKRIAACRHEVWVAPTSIAMIENEDAYTVCHRCYGALAAAARNAGVPVEVRELTPEQAVEIANAMRRN